MNGKPTGGLMMVVSLSGMVEFQNELFQLPCTRNCLCPISMLVIWRRDEYEITGETVLLFYQYISLWFPRVTIRLLYLCVIMPESRLTARKNI